MEILHLEDDSPLREIMQIALTTADPDLNVVQFKDSDEALSYIEGHAESISLFVLDVRVRGAVDGLGVAQKIRELGVSTPILITSAYGMPDESTLEKYDCLWMPKPWHMMDAPKTILDLAKGLIDSMPAQSSRSKRLPSPEEMQRILEADTQAMEAVHDEPIPFDEDFVMPLAIEQTDLMVAISLQVEAASDIYKSQDAPVVEPYTDDEG